MNTTDFTVVQTDKLLETIKKIQHNIDNCMANAPSVYNAEEASAWGAGLANALDAFKQTIGGL